MDTQSKLTWRVALLSAVAAVVGAGVGGATTYLASNNAIDADRRENLRNDRRGAYADVLTTALEVLRSTDHADHVKGQLLPGETSALESAQARLGTQVSVVLLLGSNAASQRASDLGFECNEYVRAVLQQAEGRQMSRGGVTDAIAKFIASAKSDLEPD